MEEDFVPATPVAQLKLNQIKELNKVLEGLRANIKDMALDPLKVKEECEKYKREAELLRMERVILLARLEKKDSVEVIKNDDDQAVSDLFGSRQRTRHA